MKRKYHLSNYSFLLVATILATGIMGLIYINSASPGHVSKQLLGLGLGLAALFLVSLIDYNKLFHFISYFCLVL